MRNKLLENIEAKQIDDSRSNFRIGDNVKVHVRIKEGEKERIQIFEGLIIKISNTGLTKTFTVRKISYNIGVERTFLVNSPLISEIEILRSNKVRRAKLYYMRDRKGKSSRLKEVKRKK
ncbi:MAG: 50S ribosomal protein L19 [Mycoplasmataceae bacterium]|nr:50S ribosomal protein L19 [Mycoplasmataceae bacterium]